MSTSSANTALAIRVLGPFSMAAGDGRRLRLPGRKAQAIVAMLALAPHGERKRKWLQDRLWSTRGERQGADSLRHALHEIRTCLGPLGADLLRTRGDTVELDMDRVELDIAGALRDGWEATLGPRPQLLEGFDLRDPEFENWLRDERAHWDCLLAAPGGAVESRTRVVDHPVRRPSAIGGPVLSSVSSGLGRVRRPALVVDLFVSSDADLGSRELARALQLELITSLSANEALWSVHAAGDLLDAGSGYRLDGSVALADAPRVVVHLQRLSDGATVWAERFRFDEGGNLADLSRVAAEVVAGVEGALTEGEQAAAWRAHTRSVEAWECFQKAHDLERRYRPNLHLRAIALYERALELDPEYLSALTALGFCLLDQVRLGWTSRIDEAIARADSLAARAHAVAPDSPDGVALRGFVRLLRGDRAGALLDMRRAVAIAPESVEMMAYLGAMQRYLGETERAIEAYERAAGLRPHPPPWVLVNWGNACLDKGDHGRAAALFEEVLRDYPQQLRAHLGLAIATVRLGQRDRARAAVDAVRRIAPTFVASDYASPYGHGNPETVATLVRDLRRAGLP